MFFVETARQKSGVDWSVFFVEDSEVHRELNMEVGVTPPLTLRSSVFHVSCCVYWSDMTRSTSLDSLDRGLGVDRLQFQLFQLFS